MNAALLRGVTKTYGSHTAVDSLDLEVPTGSVYGFIGPNGSGKTTTIRMILHIIHPDQGEIEVLGLRGTRAANNKIGYLPEERGLYKKMTVQRLLLYYAGLKGMGAKQANPLIDEWLEKLELVEWKKKKIEALSKGMSQKIQFISTVLTAPELVILDEPFSGLDPVNMEVLRDAILELREKGSTVIFSTHDMAVAENMCDGIFMIFKGKKVLDGTMDSIQGTYGRDTIRLRWGGSRQDLVALPGIERVMDMGNYQELRLGASADPQALLQTLASRSSIQLFEVAQPSLHDIFVRIAGPEAEEAARV